MRLTLVFIACLFAWGRAQELVELPGNSPLVNIAVQFKVGAADDPEGEEGLCYLTSTLLSEGGTRKRSYQQLLEQFYPWAASVDCTVGMERVTYHTTVHRDHLEQFTPLFVEMLTQPGFQGSDLDRLRKKGKNFLSQDLRVNNDEELGKEVLYLQIYPVSHPYGHHRNGSLVGLDSVTTEKVKRFYQDQFHSQNVVLGLSGGYPSSFPRELMTRLKEGLPPGESPSEETETRVTHPASPDGRRATIVEKDTRSVAISLGFPIEVNRSHPDWAALFLFRSFFGEHRSSNSYLYQRLREARGLNYGDYAYIEYFPNGMYLTKPEPYFPRTEQIFQIWIRPVEPANAVFALRATLYELEKVVRDGLTQEQFEQTRSFLKKNAPILVAGDSRRLGYRMDNLFYGVDPFVEKLQTELDTLTLEEVNQAVKEHLKADDLEIVLVAKGARGLRNSLLKGDPSPITYNSEKPKSILQEDRVIESFPLNLDEVRIESVNDFFR